MCPLSQSSKWLTVVAVLAMLSGCDQIAQQMEPASEPVVAEPVPETPAAAPMPAPEPSPPPAPKVLPTLEELVEYSTTSKRSGKSRGVNFNLEVKLTGDDLDGYVYFAEVKDASGGEQVWPLEFNDGVLTLEKFVPNAGTNDKYMFHIKYGFENAGGGGYLEGHKPEVFQSGRR